MAKQTKFSDLEIAVLTKLYSRRRINTYHIRLDTVLKMGWKQHEKNLVKKAVENLIKKDFIRWVKRGKKALSINREKLREVRRLCEKRS